MSRHRALFGVWLVIGAAIGLWLLSPGPARAATYTVAPTPCSARPNNGGCASSPTSLTASFPTGTGGGVVVSWVTTGRPGGAARPIQASVDLAPGAGQCLPEQNNQQTCTWAWPSGLKATGSGMTLNGAYRVATCLVAAAASPQDDPTTTTSSTTTPPTSAPPTSPPATTPTCAASAPAPSTFGVAAPPAAPTGMRVAAASSQANAAVTVTWALGAEPDLSGYTLQRNGQTIASCALHGAPGPACAAKPSFVDTGTKTGQQTYVLLAERYGLTGTQQIASGPTGATISLGATGAGSALPPAAVAGTPGIGAVSVPGAPVVGGANATLPAVAAPSATAPGYNSALPYGGPANAARALTGPYGVGSSHNRVHTLALIAAGLLVLALAGHVLYLRGAVARYQRAHAGGATPVAPAPGRLHVRWGGWPPFYRDPPQPPG